MICRAVADDEEKVRALLRTSPALAVQAEVDWALWRGNPAMPYAFYLLDDTAVLVLRGGGAVLYGEVAQKPELAAFLSFHRLDRMTTTGWAPPGWQKKPLCALQWQAVVPTVSVPALEPWPAAAEIMQVLQEAGVLMPQSRDGFYVDLCLRRNHAFADVAGIREEGKLVSTAGLYSVTSDSAYLAGVATRPSARGKGYAGALIRHLCARYAGRRIALLCEEDRQSFYTRLGFAALSVPCWQTSANLPPAAP